MHTKMTALLLGLVWLPAFAQGGRGGATVYSDCLAGNRMANGERYTLRSMIVAVPRAYFKSLRNKRVRLTVTSRGGVRRTAVAKIADTLGERRCRHGLGMHFDLGRAVKRRLFPAHSDSVWKNVRYEVLR